MFVQETPMPIQYLIQYNTIQYNTIQYNTIQYQYNINANTISNTFVLCNIHSL